MAHNNIAEYLELLKSPLWENKRREILERDERRCTICGATTSLVVHHKQYHFYKKRNKMAMPWEYEDKYLVTLCKSCHEKGHEIFEIPTKTVESK